MKLTLLTILTYLCAYTYSIQKVETTGPKNGSLIIIGGGNEGGSIMNEFKKRAGGENARLIIIPTAEGGENIDCSWHIERFTKQGFKDIKVVHTYDTAVANTDEFVEPIKNATAIYFTGGRQWRIADGFLNTKAHEEMVKFLERGGVIAGTSAGATIQGSYLARGDSKNNQIMCGDHEEGLGFIKNIAIDQHVLARNRQFDILKEYPHLLGVSVDEGTAMLVEGDEFEVIGRSYVLVYDGSFWSKEGWKLKNLPEKDALFYFLKPGDRYDMKNRKVIKK